MAKTTHRELRARALALEAATDARASVARQTAASILTPRYHVQALEQMGWQLSYGASEGYRVAFTAAFVTAWQARYEALGGQS